MKRFRTDGAVQRRLGDLETPCIVVDLDRMAYNLDRMASYTVVHGMALRPHVKTHKAPHIAAQQVRLGAHGLTCATPREVEAMSDVCNDLFLAYPLLGAGKLSRVLDIPHEVSLSIAVDSIIAVDELATAAREADRPVRVLVEVDVGMRRVGVQSPAEAVALALHIRSQSPLEFGGITFYPGHIREHVLEHDDKLAELKQRIASFLDRFAGEGLAVPTVSGGSTPAAWRMHEIPGVTEVRPGTYVYNDRTTAAIGACSWDECAATVLATVVSTAVSGQAVIDAGSKALAREPMRGSEGDGFGALLDRPEVTVARLSEEHGILDLSKTEWRPRVGDLVRVVPNHICVAVHLQDWVYGVRGDQVETGWPISARGRESAFGHDGPARKS